MTPGPLESDAAARVAAALGRRDPSAADLLDRAFRPSLTRFCRGYLRDPDLAEDAVQEVFAKTLAAVALRSDLRVWLWTVARNHCLNTLRGLERRRDREPIDSTDDLVDSLTGPITGLLRAERQERIRRALASLPEAHQEVLRLRYTEGLARAEIAQVLDLPESTVKSRLFDAVRHLREHTPFLDAP